MSALKLIELIPIIGGILGTLFAFGIIPPHPKDPERSELWHRKFGKLMKVLGPTLIISGLIRLFGIL